MPNFVYKPPKNPWIETLYQDQDIILINKPAGLLSVPGRDPLHHDSMQSRLVTCFPNTKTVHRLDMATSGIMIYALNVATERKLKRQFQERQIQKVYYARVAGHVLAKTGTIDLPLICDWPNRPKQKVDHLTGKASKTHFQVISYGRYSTLIKLMPVTGRSHQLRVHMLAMGHPILGDGFYADPWAKSQANRLLLHATQLTLDHPKTKESITFSTPIPFENPSEGQ